MHKKLFVLFGACALLFASFGATRLPLFQIATTPTATPAFLIVLTSGAIQQVQLGSGFVIATNTAGQLVLNATAPQTVTTASAGGFTHSESPAGTLDGVNATFTLSAVPTLPSNLLLTRNGLVLSSGVDYQLLASAITFLPGCQPQQGDVVTARY